MCVVGRCSSSRALQPFSPFNPSTLQPFNPSTFQPFNPSILELRLAVVPSRLQYLVPELQAVVAFCDDSSIYMSSYYIDNSGTAIACGSCLVGDARSELNLHPQPNTLNLQHPQHLQPPPSTLTTLNSQHLQLSTPSTLNTLKTLNLHV